MKDFTMVIPTYNDSDSFNKLVDIIESIETLEFKFMIVDNGSNETHKNKFLKTSGRNFELISAPNNLGFGGGILFGIRACNTQHVGWMPGNLKVNPIDILPFLDLITMSDNVLVKARRGGRRKLENLKTFMAGMLQTLVLRVKMFDSGGTPTICARNFVLKLENTPLDYVFESFILYKASKMRMRIQRPQITYGDREFGQSHWQRGLRSEISLMLKILSASKSWS